MGNSAPYDKIWLINYTGRKGGGAVCAISMAKALVNNGVKVVAIVSAGAENLPEWKKLNLLKLVVVETYNNKVEFLVNSLFFSFRQEKQIRRALGNLNIDVVFCPMMAFWSGKINRIFQNAIIVDALHDPIPHSGGSRFESAWVDRDVQDADIIVVHSKTFVDYVKEKFGKPVVYFPLGRHAEYKSLLKQGKQFEYDQSKINFLFFGTFSKYKGLSILADAYKKVEAVLGKERVCLYLVGSGNFSEYKQAYAEIESCVIVNRWIPDEEVESFFTGANLICVCPYLDGTQSGAVMVALEYQVPLIVTDVGGLSEQVEDGQTALVVKAGDSISLFEAMIKLSMDIDLREEMGRRQKDALAKYDWNQLAKVLVDGVENYCGTTGRTIYSPL